MINTNYQTKGEKRIEDAKYAYSTIDNILEEKK